MWLVFKGFEQYQGIYFDEVFHFVLKMMTWSITCNGRGELGARVGGCEFCLLFMVILRRPTWNNLPFVQQDKKGLIIMRRKSRRWEIIVIIHMGW